MLKLLRTQQGNMPIPLLFECDGQICMKNFIYPLLKLGNSSQSGTLSSQRYGKLTDPIIGKAERLQYAHRLIHLIECLHYLWPSFLYTSVSIVVILICLYFCYIGILQIVASFGMRNLYWFTEPNCETERSRA
jgi:hypothetical protein